MSLSVGAHGPAELRIVLLDLAGDERSRRPMTEMGSAIMQATNEGSRSHRGWLALGVGLAATLGVARARRALTPPDERGKPRGARRRPSCAGTLRAALSRGDDQ